MTKARPHGFSERAMHGGVDRIPLPATSGALWLCGKHAIGPDPEALLAKVGAHGAVCLNEAHELEDRYPEYVKWLHAHDGSRAIWHPVPDLHAPPLGDALSLLERIVDRLRSSEHLVMHCGAGIGRAGTMAIGVLMLLGADAHEASAVVAAHRPMAGPEAGAQRDLVDALSDHFRTAAPHRG